MGNEMIPDVLDEAPRYVRDPRLYVRACVRTGWPSSSVTFYSEVANHKLDALEPPSV